jgi:hypothetical protein
MQSSDHEAASSNSTANLPPTSTARPRLESIPSELRIKIYELVFAGAKVIVTRRPYKQLTDFETNQTWNDSVEVLLTSRSTHDDAKPVLASCLQLTSVCACANAPRTTIREYYYPRIKNLKVSACGCHAFDYAGFSSLATMELKNDSSDPFDCTYFSNPEFALKAWTNDFPQNHLQRILEGGIDDLLKRRGKEALIAKNNWISELVLDTSRPFKVIVETSMECMRKVGGFRLVDGKANVKFDIDTFSTLERLTTCILRENFLQVTSVYSNNSVKTTTEHRIRKKGEPKTEIMQWDRHHYQKLGQESEMNDLELVSLQDWLLSSS